MFIYLAWKKYQDSLIREDYNLSIIDENTDELYQIKVQIQTNLTIFILIFLLHYLFLVPFVIYYTNKITNTYLKSLLIFLCFIPIIGGPLAIILIISLFF